jgi:hypothetical protein
MNVSLSTISPTGFCSLGAIPKQDVRAKKLNQRCEVSRSVTISSNTEPPNAR